MRVFKSQNAIESRGTFDMERPVITWIRGWVKRRPVTGEGHAVSRWLGTWDVIAEVGGVAGRMNSQVGGGRMNGIQSQ
jgi:hypothetical protein